MNIDPQDITIKIKILKGAGKILAQASVTLFGCWTEHGWRIMTSDHLHPTLGEYIWIQSPCFKAGAAWKEMVFVDDIKLYGKLQEKIFDSYKLEKYKQPPEEPRLPTTETQDDIVPF